MVISLGIVLAVSAFHIVRYIERQDIKAKFTLDTQNRFNAIEREIEINLEIVQSLQSFYLSSEEVTREEFREFTKPQISGHPSIQALEWIPRISDSQRHAYERAAQNELYPNFQITQRDSQGKMEAASKRDEYFPVYFLEPYIGNETALGFDLSSNPERLEALKKSQNSEKMIATERITLVQDKEEQSSFLIFIPVYKKHQSLEPVEDRNQNLIGFVVGVIRIGKIVDHALSYLDPSEIDLNLFDESADSDNKLLYSHLSQLNNRTKKKKGNINSLELKRTINVADRKWSIITKPTSSYITSMQDWHAWGASIGVMIMALLIAFYLKHNVNLVSKLSIEITERKKHEQEHKRLLRELKQINKELEQILYVTSHDLRSPLVNVDGYSKELDYSIKELMSSIENLPVTSNIKEIITPIVNKDIPESLHYIHISVAKMETLLKGILNLSRLGRSELKIEEIDMNEMMTDIIDSNRFRLNELKIKTEISKLPNYKGDSAQINQVFSNLLDNAIKYSDSERSSVINISGYTDKNQLVYCIEDNGFGIAPENQDKIFEIFYQLEPGRVKGEGMGLTIANRILEKHNGKIWIESELGKGSKFFVSLPKA
jgi:signal transduction histidine kinase